MNSHKEIKIATSLMTTFTDEDNEKDVSHGGAITTVS